MHVGDRVGVKLNINGTEQDIVLIAIEAATTNTIGFVVKLPAAHISQIYRYGQFYQGDKRLSSPFPERDKLAFNKLTFLRRSWVCKSSTQAIYTPLWSSLVTDSLGVISFGRHMILIAELMDFAQTS